MPFTDDQLEALKNSDPGVAKEMLGKLNADQRTDLMNSFTAYQSRKSAGGQSVQPSASGMNSSHDVGVSSGNYSDAGTAHPSAQQMATGSQAASMSPGGFNAQKVDTSAEDTQAQKNLALTQSNLNRPMEGAWKHGVDALHAMGLMSDQTYAKQNAKNQARIQETHQQEAQASHPFINQTIANPLNAALPGAAKGAGLAARVLIGGAAGTAYAGLDPESTLLSTATGGVLGMLAAPVEKFIGWAGSKATAAIAEKFPTVAEKLGLGTHIKPEYIGSHELKGQLNEAGIPSATWADVTGDPVLKAQQAQMALNNPKMQANRLQVNKEALGHVDSVVNDLKQTALKEGWGDLDAIKKAASSVEGGKRPAKAKAILTAINNSGEDWKNIVQVGGNVSLFLDKLTADAKFDLAEAAANPLGKVPGSHLRNALETAVGPLDAERGGIIGSNSAEAGGKGHSLLKKIQLGVEGKQPTPIIGGHGPLGITPENPDIPGLAKDYGNRPMVGSSNQPLDLKTFVEGNPTPGIPSQPTLAGAPTLGNASGEHMLPATTGEPRQISINLDHPDESGLHLAPPPEPATGGFKPQPRPGAIPGEPGTEMPHGGAGKISPTQDMTFGGLRRLRSSINDEIAAAMKGTVVGGQKGLSATELTQLQKVSAAIENDLKDFADAHPEVGKLYEDASDFYKSKIVPFKDDAFGKALADSDSTAAAKLFKTKDAKEQQRFFNILPPKAQKSVRWGLMKDALEAGEVTQEGVMGRTFNSKAVADVLDGYHRNGTMGVAFPGGEDSRVSLGMAKVLRTISGSDSSRASAPGNMAAAELARTHPTMLGLAAKTYDWATRDNLFKLMTEPEGRILMQRAKSASPSALANIINNQVPKVLGVGATKTLKPAVNE